MKKGNGKDEANSDDDNLSLFVRTSTLFVVFLKYLFIDI